MRTFVLVFLAAVAVAHADVKLPPVVSDHMVLQAGANVPVWGSADPGEKISVSIAGQTQTTTADQNGQWKVTLAALNVHGPLTLTVTANNTIIIKDVLVGEVWLCSGQSNMVFPVRKARDFDHEQPAATWPQIRTFHLQRTWTVCSPETVDQFSAVAYFFGREIHQHTRQPVGLITRAAGDTPIEFWTSWDAQKDVPELQPILEGDGRQAAAARKGQPIDLFKDRIAPLIPFSIRGAIWYQGEANSYTVHASLYGRQLATMITDWRRQWGYEFPFISVQLPEFGPPQTAPVEVSGRAFVREGVLQSLRLPQAGMAITLGAGVATNNHPLNKQEVGRRLALWALANVYKQQDVVASGPLPAGHKIAGSEVVVSFTHTDGGLVASGGDPRGFAIAGSDQKWVWANARIAGDTVIVSHPDVKSPVAVRYAWAGNPAGCNLFNGAGLPATPFRTDDLETR